VTVAAFFDLDKTILGTSSTLAFTKPLYEQGLIKRADVVQSAYHQFIFSIAGADHDQTEKMRQYLSTLVAGWEVETLNGIVKETLSQQITPTVHAEAVELIEKHKSLGHTVVIVSASGSEIVKPVADLLGADYTIATELEVFNGKYTGQIGFYAYGDNKASAIKEFADERGCDLANSFAYSDSITDLPMLEVVGHPTVVNPDSGLKEVAMDRSWPILRFEKPAALKKPIIDHPEQQKALLAIGIFAIFMTWVIKRRKAKRAAL
jgi:HAD superfamily hydrolase (TIGR01490 family)